MECTNDCAVSIVMTHNKKEEQNMTVASVYSSQGQMGLELMAGMGGGRAST